uniref:Uncharacterized protein n=1 Tax=Caenorhabditis tropicalis TaxID=1561998 RepID=A0A1I7TF45_9PELO
MASSRRRQKKQGDALPPQLLPKFPSLNWEGGSPNEEEEDEEDKETKWEEECLIDDILNDDEALVETAKEIPEDLNELS